MKRKYEELYKLLEEFLCQKKDWPTINRFDDDKVKFLIIKKNCYVT